MFNLDPSQIEQTENVQKGTQQFHELHKSIKVSDGEMDVYECGECHIDWPCERMELMLIIQAIATMSAMVPMGGMTGILERFTKR